MAVLHSVFKAPFITAWGPSYLPTVSGRFAQIYTMDGTEAQIDAREYYFEGLNRHILEIAQRCLRHINSYAEGSKNCYQRLREDEEQHPIDTMSVRIQQLDPRRQERGTHNRPTSNEVARVMITPASCISRDIYGRCPL